MGFKNKLAGVLLVTVLLTGLFFVATLVTAQKAYAIPTCEDVADYLGDNDEERAKFRQEMCADEELSFLDFKGGLEAPDASDFPTLSKAKTLREYVLNVLNFVLTFLGLLAVCVIIYGGYRYVASGGEEEGTTAGKKSIIYAIVGLLVILGSFAIVNTVIKAPEGPGAEDSDGGGGAGGGDGGGGGDLGGLTGGGAGSGSNVGGGLRVQSERFFGITIDIRRMTLNLAEAYAKFTEIQSFINQVKKQIDEIGSADKTDTEAQNKIKTWAQNVRSSMLDIKSKAEQFTNSRIAFDKFVKEIIDPIIASAGEKSVEIFNEKASSLFTEVEKAHLTDFQSKVVEFALLVYEQRKDIGTIARPGSGAPISLAFDDVIGPHFDTKDAANTLGGSYSTLRERAAEIEDVSIFQKVLESLGKLHGLILNLNAVSAIARADTIEGGVPFIVNFDALASTDPSEISIQPDQIHWDLDGDATFDEAVPDADKVKNCKEEGPTPTCTYMQPGTYRIGLRVDSSAQSNEEGIPYNQAIASGVVHLTIRVFPPASRITLTMQAGERSPEQVRSYDQDGNLIIDRDRLKVTLSEAQAGIKFDATKSLGGGGSEIMRMAWDFGDGSMRVEGNDDASRHPSHAYGKEGIYKITLIVTDSRGLIDRKIFNVYVGSPSVRILAPILRGTTETTFNFDGSFSKSDGGQIISFEWTIPGIEGLTGNKDQVFSHRFLKPGRYEVFLTAIDNAGNQDKDSVIVLVESKAPTADFDIFYPDPRSPGLVYLDAGRSFDPDPGDSLIYKWEIFKAIEKIDYDIVEGGVLEGDKDKAKVLALKFKKRGTFDAKLTVSDQHEDESLRKSNSVEKKVEIESVIELYWDENQETAAQLSDEAEAEFAFKVHVTSANEYEFNFGDGQKEQGDITGELIELKHTYTQSGPYEVIVKVKSEGGDKNQIKRRIQIVKAESPQAVIQAFINDVPIQDILEFPKINRSTAVTFNAKDSLNMDGTYQNLVYSWDFGDTTSDTRAEVEHVFTELSPEPPSYFEVTLRVSDKKEVNKNSSMSVKVPVITALPTLDNISTTALSVDRITPFNVLLKAIGAKDSDGQINEYRFWYYDVLEPANELGVKISSTPETELMIGTKGAQGEEHTFAFCVALKDNENNFVSCEDLLPEKKRPEITAKNGPNDPPISKFSVDKTTVLINEAVQFTSSSSDPDGKIVQYIWDVLGDSSFANDESFTEGSMTYKYKITSPEAGFRVKLKVIDDKGSSSVSDPITIFVDSAATPPTSDFNFTVNDDGSVQFENLARADEANGAKIAKYEWDFNHGYDSNMDGNPKNDIDSTLPNPMNVYQGSGMFTASLTVTDSFGETAMIRKPVTITSDAVEGIQATPGLKAVLTTSPRPGSDEAVHLFGTGGEITFSFEKCEGEDIVEYVIDKNIYFDTNSGISGTPGDGIRNNDVDYKTSTPTQFVTSYTSEWEPIAAKLTIKDKAGHTATAIVPIVFTSEALAPTGAASFFNTDSQDSLKIFATLFFFVIVGVVFYYLRLRYGRKK